MEVFASPRLVADIGGQHARFALEVERGRFTQPSTLRCADHDSFESAVAAYLESVRPVRVEHAAVAIANPVAGDQVRMTNYHWQFSIEEVRQHLDLHTLVVVNDFTALAMAVPRLGAQDTRQVGGGEGVEGSVLGVLGSGSGLGMSGLVPAGDGWTALGSEGGHMSFAPRDEREMIVLRHAWRQFEHVSFERLVSAPGLSLIHQALAADAGVSRPVLSPVQVTQSALHGEEPLCVQALEVFCGMLGTAASNLAVTLGALGGVYIGGAIVPRLGGFFDASPFRARFEDKGRFRDYLSGIPTRVITAPDATFTGVSAILDVQLRAAGAKSGEGILGRVRQARAGLSPAEARVADLVLNRPRSFVNDSIQVIADAAQVSQPTVIRFCRTMGCKGLSDFKLRLASGLAMSVAVTHSQVTREDSSLELGSKVLSNTANAILQLRSELDRDMIDRSVSLIAESKRLEIFAAGAYAPIAQDSVISFLRLGIACTSHADPELQLLAARAIAPGAVAILLGHPAQHAQQLALQECLHERGARVIVVTGRQSPLARKAEAVLRVDHGDESDPASAMIGRLLHLLTIDIVAMGLSMRQGTEA